MLLAGSTITPWFSNPIQVSRIPFTSVRPSSLVGGRSPTLLRCTAGASVVGDAGQPSPS